MLPILTAALILYEFNTYGYTIDASVNKVLIGTIYGILFYAVVYIIKTIVVSVINRFRAESEIDMTQVIEP